GDSGKPGDVDRLLDGARIHLAYCDPQSPTSRAPRFKDGAVAGPSAVATPLHARPNVSRGPEMANLEPKWLRADRLPPRTKDGVGDEASAIPLHSWLGNIGRVLLRGRGFYIWCGDWNFGAYLSVLREVGLHFSQPIVWVTEQPVSTRKDFAKIHELVLY